MTGKNRKYTEKPADGREDITPEMLERIRYYLNKTVGHKQTEQLIDELTAEELHEYDRKAQKMIDIDCLIAMNSPNVDDMMFTDMRECESCDDGSWREREEIRKAQEAKNRSKPKGR